jgi:hypothetical protein
MWVLLIVFWRARNSSKLQKNHWPGSSFDLKHEPEVAFPYSRLSKSTDFEVIATILCPGHFRRASEYDMNWFRQGIWHFESETGLMWVVPEIWPKATWFSIDSFGSARIVNWWQDIWRPSLEIWFVDAVCKARKLTKQRIRSVIVAVRVAKLSLLKPGGNRLIGRPHFDCESAKLNGHTRHRFHIKRNKLSKP